MSVAVTTLQSGIQVVTDTMPHLESASLGVYVHSGSRDERNDEHGVSHFLEHMAFKGTRRRTARQIAEEIEAVGGDLNAATGAESTWTTETQVSDSGTNAVFVPDPAGVGLSGLVSPSIAINVSKPQLTFRNYFILEPGPGTNAPPADPGAAAPRGYPRCIRESRWRHRRRRRWNP